MKQLLTVLFLIAATTSGTFAQSSRTHQYNLEKSGLAIEGYDPVAYFAAGKAIEGRKELSLQVDGVTYQFSTPQNRDLFKANPTKYEPQYGGWCAYAMGAKGEKVEVDPGTFKVLDGKLYLFYNKYFNNTLKSWNKDEVNLKARADNNWTKINK
ncbi:MAG: YHS domain protein [Bacteroidetes bacterium]|nr:YHS domain protein [Bacteroidota bacterium]